MPFSYVLPLATEHEVPDGELTAYLAWLSGRCELLIVDGSPPAAFAAHARHWGHLGRHLAPEQPTPMGKVANVLAGVAAASHERVVVADDDVRFGEEVHELVARLDDAEVVRPQCYFDPVPWHAAWDSARSLLARLAGGDWPGTLALRRSVLLSAGGYAGDVMFENFELCRTVEAAGGRHRRADGLFVRRLPPTTAHFWSQRVRQAYDELARPVRLAAALAVLPAATAVGLWGGRRALGRVALAAASLAVVAAEAGRRRQGARRHFPVRCALAAPLWCAERAVCAWLALAARCRGGVRYRGQRIRRAALRPAERRRRVRMALLRPCTWSEARPIR